MRGLATLLLSIRICTSLINFCQANCHTWTKAEEDLVCSLVSQDVIPFCTSPGAADDGCKHVATTVGGADPQCVDSQVCSFALSGETAYVSCNATKPGYEILRNCVKNVGAACPNATADLSGE